MTTMRRQLPAIFGLALGLASLPRVEIRAAPPDVEEIGRILGYPGAELVASDVTDEERFIYSVQSASESIKGLAPPMDPARIRSAYRITGRTPESFLPILITVADEGTYLGPEVRDILDQLEAAPRAELMDQIAEYLGYFQLHGGSEGGLIMGKPRRPSDFEGVKEPGFEMATISEVTHPRDGIDIRVAMQFGIDQGGNADLVEIPGGARYHGYFRDPRGAFEEPWPDAPAFDWLKAFKGLNRVALKAYRADQRTAAPESRTPEGSSPMASLRSPPGPVTSVDRAARDGNPVGGLRSTLLAFAVAGALVLVLALALVKRKLE